MQARIFPMSTKIKAWHNWTTYLNLLSSEINSLSAYIDCFNPNFQKQNLGEERPIDLSQLRFRQYYEITEDCNIMWNGEEKRIGPGTIVLATKNAPTSIDDFLLLSSSPTTLYLPNQGNNSLSFNYIDPATSVIGNSILLNISGFPSRYYTCEEVSNRWPEKQNTWSVPAATWTNTDSAVTPRIVDKQGLIWDNSFPIMHKLEVVDGNNYEDFITDDGFTTEKLNIANHLTVSYNITIPTLTAEDALSDWVQVNII